MATQEANTQEKAKEVAGQAQEKASQAAEQAKSRLSEQVDSRSTQAGEQVKSQASDLRSVAEQLRQQGKDTPARLADQTAERAERAGRWLSDSDGDRIIRDVERLGRQNPWAVVGAGLFVGFAASRLLKASSSDRYHGSVQPPTARGTV